jgi:nucleoside-diphosphate-sugar epimerase
VYNVPGGDFTMAEIVRELAEALHVGIPWVRLPGALARALVRVMSAAPTGSFLDRRAAMLAKWLSEERFDGTAFRRDFGFSPTVSLSEGIRSEVARFRAAEAATR